MLVTGPLTAAGKPARTARGKGPSRRVATERGVYGSALISIGSENDCSSAPA